MNDKLDWNISKSKILKNSSKISSGAQRNGNALAWLGFEMAIKIMLKSLTDKRPIKNPLYNVCESGDGSFTMI